MTQTLSISRIKGLIRSDEDEQLIAITLDKPSKVFENPTITVQVSKAKLAAVSWFFTHGENDTFTHPDTSSLRVRHTDETTFNLFLRWLDKAALPSTIKEAKRLVHVYRKPRPEVVQYLLQQQRQLVRLWLFAVSYVIPGLAECAITDLVDVWEWMGLSNGALMSNMRACVHRVLVDQGIAGPVHPGMKRASYPGAGRR